MHTNDNRTSQFEKLLINAVAEHMGKKPSILGADETSSHFISCIWKHFKFNFCHFSSFQAYLLFNIYAHLIV